ncbi:MAG: DinB family protein [Actinomycetia bacterium]|nr:DinB family protein [Actinomycetes bacterium]
MLVSFLDFYRASLLDRAFGLTDDQLQVALPPSTLTLSRLIGHMSGVEEFWFCEQFAGQPEPEDFAGLDWEADPDAEMSLAQTWTHERLVGRFDLAVGRTRRVVDDAASLDQTAVITNRDGERQSLRWILVHMIEEYARHCGHADLIRQSIDGDVVS